MRDLIATGDFFMRKNGFETDAFKASWRFIRYDDYEIFEADEAFWDKTAKEIAEAGFTHVMTFSNTHFRWSFYAHWPMLTGVLRKLVAACHKYGLYVVEHHSANLIYVPEVIGAENKSVGWKSPSISYWKTLKQEVDPDAVCHGVRLGSMFQVDGRIGRPHETFYHAHIMCHNNPDYMRIYKEYLASLYETGIDGIMTDDVQFLAEGFASCACPHCRSKFYAATGCELPESGEAWERFIANEKDELFIKWKKFRYESIVAFHQEIKKHYEELGYKMMRPNFAATCVSWRSPWGGIFDELPALDWAFIEHCCGVIRYSWPEYIVESIHCNMMDRQRNIPAMSLYYPKTRDTQRLCWALSLYANHRYFGDPENLELYEDQAMFHRFEEAHFEALFKMKPNVRTAVWDSPRGRELDPEYNTRSRGVLCGWGQAMTRFNLPWTMTSAAKTEEYDDFKLIIVPGTTFMHDKEIADLAAFAARGGILVWLKGAGSWNIDSITTRNDSELARLLDVPEIPDKGEVKTGNGRIIFVRQEDYPLHYLKRCSVKDNNDRDAFDCAEPTRWRLLTQEELVKCRELVDFIASLLPDGAGVECEMDVTDLLISTAYLENGNAMAVKICNAVLTQSQPEEPGFGALDPIPFPEFENNMILRVLKPEKYYESRFSDASAYTEQLGNQPITVDMRDCGRYLELEVPMSKLHEFMLIEIK